ncbi:MAG: Asp23/Gls24 family envelope stress response protein [Hyphomonadaceae bacterium]|nr:Asp23/Gls24 family envelope stress response protein [Clostridia bacterium]
MAGHLENAYGNIDVNNGVIADLVGIAVSDCYGVVGMAFRNKADGLVNLLKKDALSKGIKVLIKQDAMTIDLHIIVEYGVNIPVICENLLSNVKFSVETTTGFRVEKINVYVESVRVDE